MFSVLSTAAFAAESKVTVTGTSGSSTVTVTVTGLKSGSYYFGAVQQNGTILSLFDGVAKDGKLTANVNIGKVLAEDETLLIGLSENTANGDSVSETVKVSTSGATTPDPDEPGTDDPDKPGTDDPGTDKPGTDKPGTDNKPLVPTTSYWISTYRNSRGRVSVYARAQEGQTVWVTLYPNSGYYADGITVTDSTGRILADVYYQGNDRYTFTMPAADVWVDAIFASTHVSRPSYSYTPSTTTTQTNNTYTPSYNSGTYDYRDVPRSAWYYNAVQYVYRYNLMSGTGSGYFSPNQTTTRAMVVTMLHNMAGNPAPGGGKFDDVADGAWYTDAVAWSARNNIASGYGGFFRPNENVTREQMALMMYNYAKFQGCDVSAQSGLTGFSDGGQVSTQTLKAVRWANAVGLLNGVSGGRLDPKGPVTRAQIASILMNFREKVVS